MRYGLKYLIKKLSRDNVVAFFTGIKSGGRGDKDTTFYISYQKNVARCQFLS
jgi:hypothetical protein